MEWDAAQKAAFVEMPFDAQHAYYQEHYVGAAFDVILVFGQPAGRLYVSREDDEIRIVDIALLPDYCNRGIGTTLLRGLQSEAAAAGKPRLRTSRYGGQAAAHPRRTLQSRAPALRAARVPSDRRSGSLFVHGMERGRQLPTSNSQLPRRVVRTTWVKGLEQAGWHDFHPIVRRASLGVGSWLFGSWQICSQS